MIQLKTYEEFNGFEYSVCEVKDCPMPASKVFMIQARYLEVCEHHHEDMTSISFIS
jgi:predicted GNAT superfamily acetyltransferase